MQVSLNAGDIHALETATLVAVCFESAGDNAARWNQASGGWVEELYAGGEFKGKSLECALLHRPPGLKAKRLLLVGAGKREAFDPSALRRVAGAALRFAKGKGATGLSFALDAPFDGAEFVQAAAEGAILGGFEPDQLKTGDRKIQQAVEALRVCVAAAAPELELALERGRVMGESQNYSRGLVNQPANLLSPQKLATAARELAAGCGLECEVLDQDRMRQLGMGALLGVAQGSAEPPVLVVLRYQPPAGAAPGQHLALIGKGVTFDTGGYSIKPSDGMEKMKYDMAGAAAVLGAMRAIAQLQPAVTVTGFAPCVENMVGPRAQRPGDIVTSLSGKTIEVLNTDAEGRLILADAITYAIRQGCTHLVDAATLTGAIAVALGHLHSGLFTNDEGLRDRVLAAARAAGERAWHMPLDDDYKDYLKNAFADLPNIGGRYGGAVTAAKFLEEFVEGKPWVHLDIAGTAWLDEEKPFLAKGPTGVPVRTLVRLALDWPGDQGV